MPTATVSAAVTNDLPDRARVAAEAHVPALDGVRGCAILLVLLIHTVGNSGLPEDGAGFRLLSVIASVGWTGVDLFFVLSGYLITGILWDTRGSRSYLRNFYARRTLRIFPLYYGFLAVTLLVAPWITGVPTAPVSKVWFWLYLSNWYLALSSVAAGAILTVTWSLAIEEQFYLIWPAIVGRFSLRTLIGICGAILPAAMVLRWGLIQAGWVGFPAYMLTFARMDALAVGAGIALLDRMPGGRDSLVRQSLPVGIVAAIVLLALGVLDRGLDHVDPLMQVVGFSAIALLYGAILVAVLAKRPYVRMVFESSLLQLFGRYSYAIYLFHLPVIAGLRWFLEGLGIRSAGLRGVLGVQLLFCITASAVALFAALLSWHTYERWWLSLKRYFPREAREQREARE